MARTATVATLLAVLAVAHGTSAFVLTPAGSKHASVSSGFCNSGNRTDCGYMGINQSICQSRGCCWSPVNNGGNTPWCFFKSPPSPSCSTTPVCSGHGSCSATGQCQCTAGYATCGPVGNHDCGVDLASDVNNCGTCGHACPSGAGVSSSTCSNSQCQVTCAAGYSLCFGFCSKGANCTVAAPFSPSEMDTMLGYFGDNLDVKGDGGVAASPTTVNPDYYYHWQRDGAISMREYMTTTTMSGAQNLMQTYVDWVHKAQFASDPNGIDVRGEPKFFLGLGGSMGNVYNKGWLRPQNDGCALRSITTMLYAKQLLAAGQRDYVAANIWTGTPDKPGVQRDLQYVVQVWPDNSGDPWEEVTGQIFFDKFVQRLALIMGAELATEFGNTTAATLYTNTAKAIAANIISVHWNAAKGIIMEVPNIRELDSATHLGVLYGYAGDDFLGAASEKVQSSVSVLVSSFASYTDFTINAKDTAAGLPGLLVGRYLYDHYNGGNPNQPSGGNPWILCTAGLADIYYRAAASHAAAGFIKFTALNEDFFTQALDYAQLTRAYHRRQEAGADATGPLVVEETDSDTLLRAAIASHTTVSASGVQVSGKESMVVESTDLLTHALSALTLSGDGILIRLRYHVAGNDFHLPEELNKDTGVSQGAHDLTWSYGTVIGAMASRAKATAAGAATQ